MCQWVASLNFKLTVKAWGEKGMKGILAILLILSFYNIAKPPRCLSKSRDLCYVYLTCCFPFHILILLDIFTVKLCTKLCLTLNKTDLYILHWLVLSSSVSTKCWGQPSVTGSPSSTCTTSKSTSTVDCKSTLLHLTWRRGSTTPCLHFGKKSPIADFIADRGCFSGRRSDPTTFFIKTSADFGRLRQTSADFKKFEQGSGNINYIVEHVKGPLLCSEVIVQACKGTELPVPY